MSRVSQTILVIAYSFYTAFSSQAGPCAEEPGATVEVVDYFYDALPGSRGRYSPPGVNDARANDSSTTGGGDPVVLDPTETIDIIWSEERGGNDVPGGFVRGCSPATISLSCTATRQTTWTIGASYYVTAAYGTSTSVSITQSASYPVPQSKCGYIRAKEMLTYSEYDLYRYGKLVGPGNIVFLKGIKFATGTE